MDVEDWVREDWERKYASDLVNEATGGDASFNEELCEADSITRDHILSILQRARVPLDPRLLADLNQALEGEEPRYFVPHDRVVERYRQHHHFGTNFAEPEFELRRFSLAIFLQDLQREISEWRKYGASLESYRDGATCVAEQEFFYQTDEWKDRAAVVRIIDRFTCKRCHRSARDEMLHVHHDEHIYSVFSRQFYHNFDVVRMRTLCEQCHGAFHRSHIRGYSDFNLAPPEEIRRSRAERQAMERLHDAARECQFCFGEARRAA